MEKISDLLQKRKEKIEELKINKINLFPNGFHVSHNIRDIQNVIENPTQTLTGNDPLFITAGRMMAINNFGKSAFIRFRDHGAAAGLRPQRPDWR